MDEKRTRPNGFTLIELIVVMGIAGLMLGIGLP
jgi:prepilin-type N-terminal cleavage/methylation domain-containing protein